LSPLRRARLNADASPYITRKTPAKCGKDLEQAMKGPRFKTIAHEIVQELQTKGVNLSPAL